jgi:hypothetical protein
MLSHINLQNYYDTNFAMAQHHNWSIAEIENMIPFERDIYFQLLVNYIKEQNEKAQQARNG